MEEIPWSEEAVAVRQLEFGHPGERMIVARGTLATVIDELAKTPGKLDPSLVISLSNRRVPPFQFDPREIGRLMVERRHCRLDIY